jgi:tripartite-type tricarboxylate transporter receptor subunit TctC
LAAILIALIASALIATAARPQSNRTIKIVLPFAPGGPAYNAIRILGQQIASTGGPTIVVEPHPGVGTAIGTELVATATPDGNTLGVISNSFVLLPQTRTVNYDPLTDFAPICNLVDFPPLISSTVSRLIARHVHGRDAAARYQSQARCAGAVSQRDLRRRLRRSFAQGLRGVWSGRP